MNKICKDLYEVYYIHTPSPSIYVAFNTCILEGVFDHRRRVDLEEGVPATLIPFCRGQGCPVPNKGAGFYIKNDFGSEAFCDQLALSATD